MATPAAQLSENEKGFALATGLLLLAVTVIVAAAAYLILVADLTIGTNYKAHVLALQNAEAGVNYTIGKIGSGLGDATFELPANVDDTVALDGFGVPEGFSFEVSDLTMTGSRTFSFSCVGEGADARTQIDAICRRGSAINYAAFGDLLVDVKASSQVYSYDSGTTPNPTASDSTGNGDVGSNGTVDVNMGSTVDGDVALGDDGAGNEAVYTKTGTPLVTGTAGEDVDRVDPDPLGIAGGEYAAQMAHFAANNDNTSVGIGTSLTLSGSLTLPPGDYYFTDLTLNNGATLDIQASGDEQVNIWLTGPMEAKNGSAMNVSGQPTNFTILSSSTSAVVLKHGSHHKGLVYAPYATVEMKNSGDLYGAIWAKTADLKNSAVIYYDERLKDEYQSNEFKLVSWKEDLD